MSTEPLVFKATFRINGEQHNAAPPQKECLISAHTFGEAEGKAVAAQAEGKLPKDWMLVGLYRSATIHTLLVS